MPAAETIGLVTALLELTKLTPELVKTIGELLGLVELFELKLERLLSAEFGAGIRHLKAAQQSNSEGERKQQLWDARNCFQKAIEVETGLRKAVSLLNLACCQGWLGESANKMSALREILHIDIRETLKVPLIEQPAYYYEAAKEQVGKWVFFSGNLS